MKYNITIINFIINFHDLFQNNTFFFKSIGTDNGTIHVFHAETYVLTFWMYRAVLY